MLILIGGGLVIAGSLLPWVTVNSTYYAAPIERSGINTPDGPFVLFLGVLLLVGAAAYIGPQKLTPHARERAIVLAADLRPCPIPELARLGRTLHAWQQELCAHFEHPTVSNGPDREPQPKHQEHQAGLGVGDLAFNGDGDPLGEDLLAPADPPPDRPGGVGLSREGCFWPDTPGRGPAGWAL